MEQNGVRYTRVYPPIQYFVGLYFLLFNYICHNFIFIPINEYCLILLSSIIMYNYQFYECFYFVLFDQLFLLAVDYLIITIEIKMFIRCLPSKMYCLERLFYMIIKMQRNCPFRSISKYCLLLPILYIV